jgi:hypothetical protein
MSDLHPGQASRRRPGQTGQGGGSGAADPAGGAGASAAVRAALGQLRDAAAAHDEELPAPQPPSAWAAGRAREAAARRRPLS